MPIDSKRCYSVELLLQRPMKQLRIIGDADGLIAFINPHDASNQHAQEIISFLEREQASLSFPTTTIAETVTTLQRKHASPPLAQLVVDQCRSGKLQLVPVDEAVIALASTLFTPHGSKQNTFFDAIVAALAKQQQADAIFSFDDWHRKQGFTLAGELLLAEEEK